MRFDLSSRQRKALLERGQPIELALPYPTDQTDPLAWARSMLPDDVRHMAVSADEVEIIVRPTPGVGGLAGVLGEIRDQHRAGDLGQRVIVLAVRISPPRPRHEPLPLQWPASAQDEHCQFP